MEEEKKELLYLCIEERNRRKGGCYVIRTIRLVDLLSCSCGFDGESGKIIKCGYCASKVKVAELRQRAWLCTGDVDCDGEEEIPRRMGCCVSESQIFFGGGMVKSPDQNRERKFLPSGKVYLFAMESTEWKRHPEIFQKEKPDPLLLEVNGDLYCLAGKPLGDAVTRPSFEVYNRNLREWEALSDPPFYQEQGPMYSGPRAGNEFSYAIVGTKILISSRHPNEAVPNFPILCFDVTDEQQKWTEVTSLFDGLPFPFAGRALVLDLKDGTHDKVMFAFYDDLDIHVCRLAVNDDGSIDNSHDHYLGFYSRFYSLLRTKGPVKVPKSFGFVDLGNQKVGFVISVSIPVEGKDNACHLQKVRLLVVVIQYQVLESRDFSCKFLATRTFEYNGHSPGIYFPKLLGCFVP